MRFVIAILLAACRIGIAPHASLSVNNHTIQPIRENPKPTAVGVGSRVVLATRWEATCRHRTGWKSEESVPCNEVHHRVRVRCDESCRITAPDGRSADGRLDWGPTSQAAEFEVTTTASTLTLEVTFEHGRDRRVEKPPVLQFVVADDLVFECGSAASLGSCDQLTDDPKQILQVRERDGIPLAFVRIADTAGAYATLGKFLPMTGDRITPGVYSITVEVHPPPHTIRREVVLRVR